MKQLVLLAVIVGLFFGTLALASASPSVPPQQYYVRWKSPVTYTCTHSPGDYQLDVLPAYYDYYVPQDAQMIAVDTVDDSYGHSSGAEPMVTHWPNGAGQRQHQPDVADSKSYPITGQITLETFINHTLVYESTYIATCTANSHGTLNASIINNNRPLHFEAVSEQGLTFYHP